MKVYSTSPAETIQVGRQLGQLLMPGSVVCLKGDLGSGKTHFAKGVAVGLEVKDHVTSPTFTIINEYNGRIPFYHVDAYRLEQTGEADELGLEEYLYGAGVTLIEWPERIQQSLPEDYLTVMISPINHGDVDTRELVFQAHGSIYDKLIRELNNSVHSGN